MVFKLYNMVADIRNSGRIGRIVLITQFFLCGQLIFDRHHIMQFETIPRPLFGSLVQTMAKLCCAHLISLHRRQAQPDRDGASNHKLDFSHNI